MPHRRRATAAGDVHVPEAVEVGVEGGMVTVAEEVAPEPAFLLGVGLRVLESYTNPRHASRFHQGMWHLDGSSWAIPLRVCFLDS